MRQVAYEMTAVRIVTHVLNDRAAVRVTVRFDEFIGGRVRKAFEQHWLDGGVPRRVNNRFVGKNGIRGALQRGKRQQRYNCDRRKGCLKAFSMSSHRCPQ